MYIYKAGVIGAGTMGAGIAQAISYSGLPVVLKDVNQELVDKGIARIREIYEGRVKKGKMNASEAEQKMALVSGTASLDDFKDVDIAIEVVPEKMDLKKKVFTELDQILPESAILASNTSALSISELGSATKRPHRVIGLHFFFPAHVMKLVEVIPGLATEEEVVTDTVAFSESLRKIPIRVAECAGFLINRLLMPYLNEAAFCLQEGAASLREIDEAAVKFGLPMGPFTLVDNLGLDVCSDVVKVLLESYGNRMQPAPIWQKLYDKKRFGVKTGAGFYNYTGGSDDAVLNQCLQEAQQAAKKKETAFSIERIIYPMVNEAVICLQEGVSKAADIDLGLLAGVGFPQDKGGILHYADKAGLDAVLKGLEQLYREHGERFWPAPMLRRMIAAKFLGEKAKRGFFEYG
ncbi:MAG: 3-hydroxyacyl-CoA dehydrogenase [Candidatus Omnitrophica bacterium]|nr:3-hydroxyacyl-CoA dehydrogenase [Candidatus Omnitrophota bacterium]